MPDNHYTLRPEAGPVRRRSLNRSQFEALRKTVAALSEAVKDAADSSRSSDVDHATETDRVSRLFFVSGQPGSGKSSLYVTLRALLGKDRRHDDIRQEYCERPPTIPFSALKGKIRWLEPLDLEVAVDDGENLLAAVLVRIAEAIDHSSPSASKDCRDAMEQLEELANDIGIAWDGNLKARAGSLDPDSYSQETMRAQRTRLQTNSRLRTALDALLKNECYALAGEELFVLPIDDFYLKPKASLELLRLLRMISVPRLFFLIMGDIKTVEALFFEMALADWTAVAGPQVFATLRERTKQEVLPRVREMRARYLRKLIPAGQRAIIDWTEWDEGLRFSPPPATWGSGRAESLCKLLSTIRWRNRPDEQECNLLDYLVSPLLDKDALCETTGDLALPKLDDGNRNMVNRFREAYSGLQVLDATPRELLDLWMCLPKPGTSEEVCAKAAQTDCGGDSHLRMVVERTLVAIEEQDFLTEEDQEILRFVFPTSSRDDLQLRSNRLGLKQKTGPWRGNSNQDVLVRPHRDWRLGILGPKPQGSKCRNRENSHEPQETRGQDVQHDENGKSHLPPRVAAWIILLHDLAWNRGCDSVLLENLVQRLRKEIRDHSNSIESTRELGTMQPGWAWYRDKGKDHWVHFPLPEVDTFRELDRFLAIWSYKPGTERREPPVDPKAAVQKWAMAAWITKEGSENLYEEYVKSQDDNQDKGDSAKWYEECASSLDKSGNADGSGGARKFADFRKKLFNGRQVLLDWAGEGGK